MKKLALIIAVAGIVGLSSCGKANETKCTITTGGINTTITVSEDEAKSCVGAICATTSLGSTSQADYVAALEAAGYECK